MSRIVLRRWFIAFALFAQALGSFAVCACAGREGTKSPALAMSCHGGSGDVRISLASGCCCENGTTLGAREFVAAQTPDATIITPARAIANAPFAVLHRGHRVDPPGSWRGPGSSPPNLRV